MLRGWFMDSPGARATVVLLHDTGGTRADPDVGMLRLQRDYLRRGYNTFAFDLRGRGESSGNRDYLGADEQIDLRAAVAYARGRSGSLPLLLHGFGLGASLAMQAVGEGLPVAAVIADSPFASAREQLRSQFRRVPGHLFKVACWLAWRVYRADVNALAPIRTFDLAPSSDAADPRPGGRARFRRADAEPRRRLAESRQRSLAGAGGGALRRLPRRPRSLPSSLHRVHRDRHSRAAGAVARCRRLGSRPGHDRVARRHHRRAGHHRRTVDRPALRHRLHRRALRRRRGRRRRRAWGGARHA